MTALEIARRMDGLGLWEAVSSYHWAIKPRGTVIPYFFCILGGGPRKDVRVRALFLEGWQTFHDFVRTNLDRNFGFYQTPMELPHFELAILADGTPQLFRHDPGYVPCPLTPAQEALCARIFWETYGILLRIESERNLPLKFAAEKAIFARVEDRDGTWSDRPLVVPKPRPHEEVVSLPLAQLEKAKELPFIKEMAIEVDFRLIPKMMVEKPRARCIYLLAAIDAQTHERLMDLSMTVEPEKGLRGLWEEMPRRFLAQLVEGGRIPGEVKVLSGRVFRMLRPVCERIPFKLSLHDNLPQLEEALRTW